jgi:hypothetical protein
MLEMYRFNTAADIDASSSAEETWMDGPTFDAALAEVA